MESIAALFDMGGYGGYVWPAYGISAVVLTLVLVLSRAASTRNEAELEALQRARRGRRDSGTESGA
jgi:heme exporter protein D